jgi:hypothetical protein
MKRTMLANKEVLSKNTIPFARTISNPFSFFTISFIIKVLLLCGMLFFVLQVYAQPPATQSQADYRKVLSERTEKIVRTLGIVDSEKNARVQNILVEQYINLNAIHDESKAAIKEIKDQSLAEREKAEAIKVQDEKKSSRLTQLHRQFIAQLKKELSDEQLEKVKDGMTYNVCPITYAAYLEMLPNLSTEQKGKIYGWLTEARELAMDEGSSEKKHAVFGKYKGRVNNYLSAAGYDMKKEGEEWQKRIKEREANSKEQKGS